MAKDFKSENKACQLVDKKHYQELLQKCEKLEKEVEILRMQKVILKKIISITGLLIGRKNKTYYASAS